MKTTFKILSTVIILTTILIFAGCQKTLNKENITSQKTLSDTIDGIDLEISNIETINGQTIMNLDLSNHAYDISQMDIKNLSSLNGKQAITYTIENTKMGGHHIEAQIVFTGEAKGVLIIGLNEDIIFNYNL